MSVNEYLAPILLSMSENPLESLIAEEARRNGPLTFARFMELALYHPTLGYYSSGPDPIGGDGDFYTSPGAHPAFGALLAVQLADMWDKLGDPSPFHVVELGPGTGLLAADTLEFVPHLSPAFSDALNYVTIDRSLVHTVSDAHPVISDSLPLRNITGCILSNEYFDALPVHRVMMRGDLLREIYVGLEGDALVEVIDDPSTPLLQQRLTDLNVTLIEGQKAEINLTLDSLARSLSQSLHSGYVLTIDYGHPARDLYSPSRLTGTLACHYQHTLNNQPLRRIGRQDITAHVDFTTLAKAGECYGLQPSELITQRDFLGNLGIVTVKDRLRDQGLTTAQYNANLMALGNLIDPDALGAFKVLIQSKGVELENLSGLGGPGRTFTRDLPVPLPTRRHLNLLHGKYPHLAWEAT